MKSTESLHNSTKQQFCFELSSHNDPAVVVVHQRSSNIVVAMVD